MPKRIKDLRRWQVTKRIKRHQKFFRDFKQTHLFDSSYWYYMVDAYKKRPKFKKIIETMQETIAQSRKDKLGELNENIKRKIKEFIDACDYESLHAAVSYCVGQGFVDAPRTALVKAGLYDWAAAVEEGRGEYIKWESVVDLYAKANATYHLKRLQRELPTNVLHRERILGLISDHLKNLKRK